MLMFSLTEDLITKIGQVAVGAGELEVCLAVLAGHEMDLNVLDILARPGEALRSARQAIAQMDEPVGALFEQPVNDIEELLKERNRIIHSMWVNEASPGAIPVHIALQPRTKSRIPVEDFALDDLPPRMIAARKSLIGLLSRKINNELPPTTHGISQPPTVNGLSQAGDC